MATRDAATFAGHGIASFIGGGHDLLSAILETVQMTNTDDKCELLLDSNRGVYIPQHFCQEFKLKEFGLGDDDKDVKTCLNGPDDEWYWEAWAAICDKAVIMLEGHACYLYHDGDLWVVRDDMPEEWFP